MKTMMVINDHDENKSEIVRNRYMHNMKTFCESVSAGYLRIMFGWYSVSQK
jgi:hypothetical protein